jgi:hypothetical protein
MTGTFIDTIIVCTMTGLAIVMTGAWDMGLEGVAVTTKAFALGLPFPAKASAFVLMMCLVFFAFTTILGWNYYGERCMEYLFNRNKKVVMTYRWLYILAVFIGPYMTVAAVWNIPVACNECSADYLLSSPLMSQPHEHRILHTAQLITGQCVSQVIKQAVGTGTSLAITLQTLDVTVLVITRNVL